MNSPIASRRTFLFQAALAGAALPQLARAKVANHRPFQTSIHWNMLPRNRADEDRFALLRECGFNGVVLPVTDSPGRADQLRKLAEQSNVIIHAVSANGWNFPLSEPNAAIAASGIARAEAALHFAASVGAAVLTIIPGRMHAGVGYADAYHRSQKNLREILPLARKLKVTIAVEMAMNGLLQTPLEYKRYIDAIGSRYVRACVDTGIAVRMGYPADWLTTLDHRVALLQVRDYDLRKSEWRPPGEGDVNWPKVARALNTIGYDGAATAHFASGDPGALSAIQQKLSLLLSVESFE